jgi:hypothetical protein
MELKLLPEMTVYLELILIIIIEGCSFDGGIIDKNRGFIK